MDVPISDRRWDTLKPSISKSSLEVLKVLKFDFMTPVQSTAIPYFMKNKDVAVEAVTGSGKTLAFAIPVIEILTKTSRVGNGRQTGALVLTPTRELATQISNVFETFLKGSSFFRLILLIGGRDVQVDVAKINYENSMHIVVATPGRLVDLLGRQDCSLAASLRHLEVLVLDEADRLLELGFEQSINTILSYCPKQRRTGLFSATLNQNVKALIKAGLRNPVTITVKDKRTATDQAPTPKSLSNFYLVCDPIDKMCKLLQILAELQDKKVIVFFATCASVSYFSTLAKRLIPQLTIISIHGKMHKKRQLLFTKFSECSQSILMCTDIMARGVDFPSVEWVIQFDPPSSAKAFVHRCGRTARMGRCGQALVMLLPSEVAYVDFLSVNQHISLQPYTHTVSTSGPSDNCIEKVRNFAVKEREIYELGKKAFVSFVHFYFKHECKLIFQPNELDLVGLAKGYALPHLPRMPELRGLDTSCFDRHPTLPAEIKYKDKTREKQRLLKLKESPKCADKASHCVRRPLKRMAAKSHGLKARKKQKIMTDSDMEELAMEARLLRKFKAGKITKKELDEKLDDFS